MTWFRFNKALFMALVIHSPGQAFMYDSKVQQSTTLDVAGQVSRNDFVRLAFHSSAVAGDTLYIDGGEITLLEGNSGQNRVTTTQNKTLTIDLSKSWTTSGVEYGSIDKDSSVPVLNYGALWTSTNDNFVLSFGGVRSSYSYSPRIANIELWEYSTTSGWTGTTSQSPASPTLTNSRPAAAASAFGNGIGYMLGGIRGNDNAPWWPLPGLLTYNMANNTWTNESTTSAMPYSSIGGSLTFVPSFGTEGVLIAMGGEYTGDKPWMEMATNFVPFTNISIWDIASKTWYWQNATANDNPMDIPPIATMFCSVGVSGQNGTFEIFIYGGHSDTFVLSSKTPSYDDLIAQQVFNNVHVLSLPGFVWTRVDAGTTTSRTGHTCNIVGNRQMLSIGGLNPMYKMQDAQDLPDNFTQGLGIFDMVDLKWTTSYDANAARYITPGIVQEWYDTHATDALVDWSSPGVEALFNHSTNSSVLTLNISSGSTNNIVIPAAVGAILGTLLLAGLAMLLYRRSRKRYKEGHSPEADTGSGDTLTRGLRSYLAKSRRLYLAQRQAFLRQNVRRSTAPATILKISRPFAQVPSSHLTRNEHPSVPSHIRNNESSGTVLIGYTPETWSATQYPNHPAFAGTRSHTPDHEADRGPRSFESARTAHTVLQPDANQQSPHQAIIPPLNTILPSPPHIHDPHDHRISSSEWSMSTTSTTTIPNHKDFWDRSVPHSPSTIPELSTENERGFSKRTDHGARFELE